MKEFENKIYRRLLAPVLACLVLALAGCSQDATEAEAPSSPTGGTYLTIVTRGINTTDDTQYEDYVKTLRVIAFKGDATASLNVRFEENELPDHTGSGDDAEVDLTNQEKLQIGTGGGSYTFYFIANEDNHFTTSNTDLSKALSADDITAETLESMQVTFTQDEIKAPSTPISKYMLMSTKMTVYIEEGVKKPIEIELVRALAKAQLVLRKETAATNINFTSISAVIGNGMIPVSYSLLPDKGEVITNYLSDEIALSGSFIFEEDGDFTNIYMSETFYLPERYLTDENNYLEGALNLIVTTANPEKEYAVPIGDDKGDSDATNNDYNIIRNTAYTTTGTFSTPITINSLSFTCASWFNEKIVVPPYK